MFRRYRSSRGGVRIGPSRVGSRPCRLGFSVRESRRDTKDPVPRPVPRCFTWPERLSVVSPVDETLESVEDRQVCDRWVPTEVAVVEDFDLPPQECEEEPPRVEPSPLLPVAVMGDHPVDHEDVGCRLLRVGVVVGPARDVVVDRDGDDHHPEYRDPQEEYVPRRPLSPPRHSRTLDNERPVSDPPPEGTRRPWTPVLPTKGKREGYPVRRTGVGVFKEVPKYETGVPSHSHETPSSPSRDRLGVSGEEPGTPVTV